MRRVYPLDRPTVGGGYGNIGGQGSGRDDVTYSNNPERVLHPEGHHPRPGDFPTQERAYQRYEDFFEEYGRFPSFALGANIITPLRIGGLGGVASGFWVKPPWKISGIDPFRGAPRWIEEWAAANIGRPGVRAMTVEQMISAASHGAPNWWIKQEMYRSGGGNLHHAPNWGPSKRIKSRGGWFDDPIPGVRPPVRQPYVRPPTPTPTPTPIVVPGTPEPPEPPRGGPGGRPGGPPVGQIDLDPLGDPAEPSSEQYASVDQAPAWDDYPMVTAAVMASLANEEGGFGDNLGLPMQADADYYIPGADTWTQAQVDEHMRNRMT